MVYRLLTDRQAEVLRHLCAGLCEDEVAVRLGIQPSTVKLHRQHIRHRVGVTSIEELCRMAEEGVDPPPLLRRAVSPPPGST